MMTFAHAKEANSRTFARETTSLKSTNLQFFQKKDIKRESFSIYGSFSVCHSAQSSTHCHGVQTLFKNIWIPYGCTSLLHTASVSADSKLLLRDAAA